MAALFAAFQTLPVHWFRNLVFIYMFILLLQVLIWDVFFCRLDRCFHLELGGVAKGDYLLSFRGGYTLEQRQVFNFYIQVQTLLSLLLSKCLGWKFLMSGFRLKLFGRHCRLSKGLSFFARSVGDVFQVGDKL